jgi:hypothetical protein
MAMAIKILNKLVVQQKPLVVQQKYRNAEVVEYEEVGEERFDLPTLVIAAATSPIAKPIVQIGTLAAAVSGAVYLLIPYAPYIIGTAALGGVLKVLASVSVERPPCPPRVVRTETETITYTKTTTYYE